MQARRGRENGWWRGVEMEAWTVNARGPVQLLVKAPDDLRSAERRVGKECSSRGSPYDEKESTTILATALVLL